MLGKLLNVIASRFRRLTCEHEFALVVEGGWIKLECIRCLYRTFGWPVGAKVAIEYSDSRKRSNA